MSAKGAIGKLRNAIVAIGKGDFIVKMRVDRYFAHIIVIFLLCLCSMYLSFKAEQTMLRKERNKAEIETLKIRRSQMAVRIASMNRLTTVDAKLKEMGSELEAPQQPATEIDE